MGLESYVKAAIPETYTILGLRLKPFCLGHFFLMKRYDCAFASEDPETMGSIADLLLGLCICSMSYEEFLEFIADGKSFSKWATKWGKAVKKQIKSEGSDFNLFDKFTMFRKYMLEGTVVPKFWEGDAAEENKGESGAHWTQSVLLVLTGELGYSQSEALNLPLSKALADYFKFAERNGLVVLMTEEEEQLIGGQ